MRGVAAAPFPQAPAMASCAAPYLKVPDRLVLQRGSAVTIKGRSFTEGGCQDGMSCTESLGCDSCTCDDPPPVPMDDVSLRLQQRDRTWDLGVADEGSAENNHLGWCHGTIELPAGVTPGPAKLLSEHARPVRIQIS